jgi:cation diffusion facilitator family transporter
MPVDSKKHYRRIRFILIVILALNWGVAIAKVIFGLFTKCQSMTADGFHSLSDGASNIIGLIGIALSSRPTDEDHPYGHRKYETFFSMGIAALLFLLAMNLMRESFGRFLRPITPEVTVGSFGVMMITMIINIFVMKYEYNQGKALASDFLVADSMHTKADIFTSISVIGALVGIKLGYPVLDPIVTFIISVFIGYAGFEIVRGASKILCDTVAIDTVKVAEVVLAVKGVKECHKIRTRGRPDDICIDLHVQVDPEMHIDHAHKICYAVEEALKSKIPKVTDVLVHIEPRSKRKK